MKRLCGIVVGLFAMTLVGGVGCQQEVLPADEATVLLEAAVLASLGPVSGAIFTTDSSCTGVDLNIYESKDDVYIDGGPKQPGSAGLPDGEYAVQVTEPNGTLLGTSVGSGDETPVTVVDGEFATCYQLSAILIKASDGTPGYDDTSNPGGEYKVWVSQSLTFDQNQSKTDNFKAGPEGCEPPPEPCE